MCFLQMILRKTMMQFCRILKMNKNNSIKVMGKTNLSEQTKF